MEIDAVGRRYVGAHRVPVDAAGMTANYEKTRGNPTARC